MAVAALITAALLAAVDARPPVLRRVQYAFDLSSFEGEIEASWGNIAYDPDSRELFLLSGRNVSVFKDGMLVFEFAVDEGVAPVSSLATLPDGDLLLATPAGMFRHDYRGRLRGRFALKGAPASLAAFAPTSIHRAAGRLYLFSGPGAVAVACEEDGTFLASYDLAALAFRGLKIRSRADQDIGGFAVDSEGNLLFTVPTLAKVFVVSPQGKVHSFGRAGSKNGDFNLPGPIVRDQGGILYVADVVRSTILVFDREYHFLGEFGGRGRSRQNLLAPSGLAVGGGLLFVSQGAGRGVRVFRVVFDE